MRHAVLLILAGLVAGCYGPPGSTFGAGANPNAIQREAIVPQSPAMASAEAVAALTDLGLRPVPGADNVFTTILDRERNWAFCPPRRIRDDNRIFQALPRTRHVQVQLSVTPAPGGARVAIGPDFYARYYDRVFVRNFEGPCNSFGILEQEFFARLPT